MKKMSKHVFAIVRFDGFLAESEPINNRIIVKEIVLTEDEAKAEVQRLNAINKDKKCFYFWQTTRLVE